MHQRHGNIDLFKMNGDSLTLIFKCGDRLRFQGPSEEVGERLRANPDLSRF